MKNAKGCTLDFQRRNPIWFLLLSIIIHSCASSSIIPRGKYNTAKTKEARQHIKDLKTGALLVRLQEKRRSIDALIKQGRPQQAKEYKEELDVANKRIVRAFTQNYTFSEVYFIYSSESEKISKGDIAAIHFLDKELKVDTSITCSKEKLYIAEFGELEQSEEAFEDGYRSRETDNGPERVKTYSGGADLKIAALLIRDQNFVQLQRPFPYYVRTFRSKLLRKDPFKVVRTLNENLFNYY